MTFTIDDMREDIALALGATGGINEASPCWKCGANQPAHNCAPEHEARGRLLTWAGAETHGNSPLRTWKQADPAVRVRRMLLDSFSGAFSAELPQQIVDAVRFGDGSSNSGGTSPISDRSNYPQAQQGPAEPDDARAERVAKLNQRVKADLWSATWEASQAMSYDEIRQFVEATISEIVSDEP